ncbi:MAG: type II toxin-antitoxin system VapC family toxin [Acidobacteriota bacterium]
MAVVLDSSAVVAVLQSEPGADVVLRKLSDSVICSVNASEAIRVVMRKGATLAHATNILSHLFLPVVPFGYEDAILAAEIGTQHQHLSFGDCACIALARRESASEVLTADRIWADMKLGVKVTLIR